jgi:hypothetical protein
MGVMKAAASYLEERVVIRFDKARPSEKTLKNFIAQYGFLGSGLSIILQRTRLLLKYVVASLFRVTWCYAVVAVPLGLLIVGAVAPPSR